MTYDLEKILPHKRPMILIDDIKEINMDEKYLISEFSINGVNYLAGIEFMAQTIGCYAFFKSKLEEPKLGFLLGTRLYKNKIEKFENGQKYNVKVNEIFCDNELVSFECLIYNIDGECASAVINAFQPDNAEEYLKNGL